MRRKPMNLYVDIFFLKRKALIKLYDMELLKPNFQV